MKNPIVDQSWTCIVETDGRGRAAAEQKLEQLVSLTKRITQLESLDVASNILDSGLIEVALLRCKQFHDGEHALGYNDLHIYYRYATYAMLEAEKVIDDELSHLGL